MTEHCKVLMTAKIFHTCHSPSCEFFYFSTDLLQHNTFNIRLSQFHVIQLNVFYGVRTYIWRLNGSTTVLAIMITILFCPVS